LILEEKNIRDHAKKIVDFLFLCVAIVIQCLACLHILLQLTEGIIVLFPFRR